MSEPMQQNPDGSWSPAEPLGWMEEHGPVARFIFWALRIPHCNDEAHRRLIERVSRHA